MRPCGMIPLLLVGHQNTIGADFVMPLYAEYVVHFGKVVILKKIVTVIGEKFRSDATYTRLKLRNSTAALYPVYYPILPYFSDIIKIFLF